MAWTTPRTWAEPEIVTETIMNTHVRDNLDYLKDRLDGVAKQYIRTATDYTTTSTSFVEVDGSNLALTFTTDGSDVLVTFTGYGYLSTQGYIDIGVDVDGTDYFLIRHDHNATPPEYRAFTFSYIFTGLSAASHTFKLVWRVETGTGNLIAGTLLFDAREALGLIA